MFDLFLKFSTLIFLFSFYCQQSLRQKLLFKSFSRHLESTSAIWWIYEWVLWFAHGLPFLVRTLLYKNLRKFLFLMRFSYGWKIISSATTTNTNPIDDRFAYFLVWCINTWLHSCQLLNHFLLALSCNLSTFTFNGIPICKGETCNISWFGKLIVSLLLSLTFDLNSQVLCLNEFLGRFSFLGLNLLQNLKFMLKFLVLNCFFA